MTIGLAAGPLAGFVVGGGLGRLFMFVLRMTSPEVAVGIESDDGFVIGRFTASDTLTLMLLTAALGGLAGVGYAVVRPVLPRRVRVGAWTALAAAGGGAAIVHTDGVDFTLLGPVWLAVGGIVAVLALGGVAMALLVERWSGSSRTRGRARHGASGPPVSSEGRPSSPPPSLRLCCRRCRGSPTGSRPACGTPSPGSGRSS
jgi:hypothetical protein